MEHIFFEVQLCIEMLIFKEKHVFPILIILCLVTSLVRRTKCSAGCQPGVDSSEIKCYSSSHMSFYVRTFRQDRHVFG